MPLMVFLKQQTKTEMWLPSRSVFFYLIQ